MTKSKGRLNLGQSAPKGSDGPRKPAGNIGPSQPNGIKKPRNNAASAAKKKAETVAQRGRSRDGTQGALTARTSRDHAPERPPAGPAPPKAPAAKKVAGRRVPSPNGSPRVVPKQQRSDTKRSGNEATRTREPAAAPQDGPAPIKTVPSVRFPLPAEGERPAIPEADVPRSLIKHGKSAVKNLHDYMKKKFRLPPSVLPELYSVRLQRLRAYRKKKPDWQPSAVSQLPDKGEWDAACDTAHGYQEVARENESEFANAAYDWTKQKYAVTVLWYLHHLSYHTSRLFKRAGEDARASVPADEPAGRTNKGTNKRKLQETGGGPAEDANNDEHAMNNEPHKTNGTTKRARKDMNTDPSGRRDVMPREPAPTARRTQTPQADRAATSKSHAELPIHGPAKTNDTTPPVPSKPSAANNASAKIPSTQPAKAQVPNAAPNAVQANRQEKSAVDKRALKAIAQYSQQLRASTGQGPSQPSSSGAVMPRESTVTRQSTVTHPAPTNAMQSTVDAHAVFMLQNLANPGPNSNHVTNFQMMTVASPPQAGASNTAPGSSQNPVFNSPRFKCITPTGVFYRTTAEQIAAVYGSPRPPGPAPAPAPAPASAQDELQVHPTAPMLAPRPPPTAMQAQSNNARSGPATTKSRETVAFAPAPAAPPPPPPPATHEPPPAPPAAPAPTQSILKKPGSATKQGRDTVTFALPPPSPPQPPSPQGHATTEAAAAPVPAAATTVPAPQVDAGNGAGPSSAGAGPSNAGAGTSNANPDNDGGVSAAKKSDAKKPKPVPIYIPPLRELPASDMDARAECFDAFRALKQPPMQTQAGAFVPPLTNPPSQYIRYEPALKRHDYDANTNQHRTEDRTDAEARLAALIRDQCPSDEGSSEEATDDEHYAALHAAKHEEMTKKWTEGLKKKKEKRKGGEGVKAPEKNASGSEGDRNGNSNGDENGAGPSQKKTKTK